MWIRKSADEDVERMMEIYAHARAFMAEHGNPTQWGPTNWPPKSLIQQDIREGRSYVCVSKEPHTSMNEGIVATFFFDFGKDIEPGYSDIKEGSWKSDTPYGVIHRLAGDGSEKGIGRYCINWAYEQCGHLRVDTHPDNVVMQNLLAGLGFERRGIIYVAQDDSPRYAYEKL